MFYTPEEQDEIMRGAVPYDASQMGPTVFLVIPQFITTVFCIAIIVVYFKSKSLWNTSAICLMNLICASLFSDGVRLPWLLANAANGSWSVGPLGCTLSGLAASISIAEMSMSLAMIAGERYFAIVRQTQIPERTAKLAIGCSWFASIMSSTTPFWFGSGMVLQPSGWYCQTDWISTKIESIVLSLFALTWINSMAFAMGYGYWEIYKKIRANTKRLADVMNQSNGNVVMDKIASQGPQPGGGTMKSQHVAYLKAREIQGQIAMKSARIVAMSMCCWLPVSLVLIAEVITRRPPPKWLDSIGAVMISMNGIVNTFSVVMVDRRFLEAIRNITGWAWMLREETSKTGHTAPGLAKSMA